MPHDMIVARRSQLPFYRNTALYIRTSGDKFILYKPAGITIRDMRVEENRIPDELFIRKEDKIKGIQ